MILKSYIIEKDIGSLNNYTSLLFYGENDGLKEDIKNEIKKINKNAEIINLFQMLLTFHFQLPWQYR